MKPFIIILLLLTFPLVSYCQNNLGIKLEGGFSQIESSSETNSFHVAITGIGGLSYYFNIEKKSVIGVELLFQQIEDKNNLNFNLTDDNGNNIGNFSGHTYKQLSYVGQQSFYGFKINKFSIQIGERISILARDYLQIKGVANYNGSETKENLYNQLYLKLFDLGPICGIQYDLTYKFSI